MSVPTGSLGGYRLVYVALEIRFHEGGGSETNASPAAQKGGGGGTGCLMTVNGQEGDVNNKWMGRDACHLSVYHQSINPFIHSFTYHLMLRE